MQQVRTQEVDWQGPPNVFCGWSAHLYGKVAGTVLSQKLLRHLFCVKECPIVTFTFLNDTAYHPHEWMGKICILHSWRMQHYIRVYLETYVKYKLREGHAIAQVASHRLPTVADWVWAQVRSCRICGRQSGTGGGFLQVLRFPLPILIPASVPC
jgi:hypothetical protein